DDSTPGAIRIPGIVTELDTLKNNGSTEEGQDPQMKRYLLCPGMCRIEVLKKFIRNKYNVDTNQFFIDVLYKRVPLPDHYTLIDIAYIYSWQRLHQELYDRDLEHGKKTLKVHSGPKIKVRYGGNETTDYRSRVKF
ncbi:hypothetical protein YQE_06532, partial [Dendroctonus ponderosae]